MGSWRLQGRERVVVPALAFSAAFAVAGALRLGVLDSDEGSGARDPQIREDAPADADPDDAETQELLWVSYEPGDCVTWDVRQGRQADTDVVPCTEQHRMQVTEQVPIEVEGSYPTEDAWVSMIESQCRPAAERFLGVPLDRYGRFHAYAIRPLVDRWADGERTMWCGIAGVEPDGSDDGLLAEDVRGADQEYHYPVGSCVALPADAAPVIVPCTEGHHMEIVGELDLSGRPEIPSGAQERGLFDDCAAQARTYLGADPVAPWQIGMETMTPERWAAGSRWVHCFLGQWDAAGEQIEVTGSANG